LNKNECYLAIRILQKEKDRNEEIKQLVEIEGLIMDDIERKQLVWYGHM